MKIVVLAGGRSTERNVSLSSSARVANALRRKGYEVALVDLFLGLEDANEVQLANLFTSEEQEVDLNISDEIMTDDCVNALRTDGTTQLFGPNVMKIAGMADLVYIGLHGGDGEGGKVQAALDLNNIPYTGSGMLASAVAMDKNVSKQLMLFNGIQTARFVNLPHASLQTNVSLPFNFPAVVKPSNGGSSVGMYIVHDQKELQTALKESAKFDSDVLVEEYVDGREFSMGVVDGVAMPAIEIIVTDGWYDFEHKFVSGNTTKFQTPPDIPDDVHDEMKRLAKKTMDVLGMTNYGRIDFLWNKNGLYVIEANTLPGMTPLSLLPQEAEAAGIAYDDLCDMIITSQVKLLGLTFA
ncbi:D-alanine--D-alanine ligase family protein [Secundilactobacillus collinoides]|uniref:D-alanine--D-alanine ligase n=2 Tax=Secundilactobacillus collinoides TaxID=33960 RepID=A0A0R2B6Q5_SECCO|nr:D-alanine--D-alanine ligase [Secundilactobacillus collinoides]KRM74581.1 D-alanine--D-alanine ligase [Secundilactobacillus collinoides DSM 20515 = JCM 1123]KZL41422.1 D-alanine--D-alanine ligase [Secundilactobacillus collinoides]